MSEIREKNYVIVRDLQTLDRVFQHLRDPSNELVSFDIETDGVEEKVCKVIGIAVSCHLGDGIYIPLSEWVTGDFLIDGESKTGKLRSIYEIKTEKRIVKELCDILLTKKLIMHNGVFDIACMVHSYGINLTEALYCDTILLKHTLDEERPFGLKDLGQLYFGEEAIDEQLDLKANVLSKGGKWNKNNKDMYMGDLTILGKYAAKDVDLTIQLYTHLSDQLYHEKLEDFFYEKEVMPLYRKATIPMKLHGIFVDVDYFSKLKKEVEDDILRLTDEVFDSIEDDIETKVREILDKYVRNSRTGKFAEKLLRLHNMPVPLNAKTGKPTLAKTALRRLEATYKDHPALEWLLWESPTIEVEELCKIPTAFELDAEGKEIAIAWEEKLVTNKIEDPDAIEPQLSLEEIYSIKKEIYVERFPTLPRVFNLSSTKHLAWLLFTKHKLKPKAYSRKTKEPKVDKDSLGDFDLPFIPTLAKLKKEEKLLGTYVIPILEKQREGWLYPSMLQFGTTSGRYSCGGGLNLQTLPKDDTRIKRGFIAPKGYKVVAADFSSLEPRIFAWVSNDEGLKRVYKEGLDLYSQIAIDVFGLEGFSAHPDDENFLKDKEPEWRDKSKIFSLSVVYGANAWRVASLLKIEIEEASDIINKYLTIYPNLKEYMNMQEEDAIANGRVHTNFGRVRHLPQVKELYKEFGRKIFNKKKMMTLLGDEEGSMTYYRFRTLLNNSKNAPIQGTAAHVTNASMIKLADLFKKNKINGWICLNVHDEIISIVKEDQAELSAQLTQTAMEDNPITREIDIPMIAVPQIGDNFAEVK